MTANLSRLKCLFRRTRVLHFYSHVRGMATRYYSTIDKKDDEIKEDKSLGITSENEELVEPTTCCMSGCANCVWIEYAEKLSKKLENSNEEVQKIIMEKVQDPNMRAFLSFELRCRNLIR